MPWLFDLAPPDPAANLLPCDGIVNDYGPLFAPPEADAHLAALLAHTPWRHDEVVIYGRRITTARQVAWVGDAAFAYTYSGVTRTATPWSATLLAIKRQVEAAIALLAPPCSTPACSIFIATARKAWPGIATMKKNWGQRR